MIPGVKKALETTHLVDARGHKVDVTVVEPEGESRGNVFFLHGAGESSKDRLLPLARLLGKRGYRGVVFSLPGHGKSSGTLHGSTLSERQAVTEVIAKEFGVIPANMFVAVSMGAHTAISMAESLGSSIDRLALFVPAIYARDAEKAPFGPAFSDVIRKPGSYLDSKIWDILPSYNGKLVTFEAERDEVIPPEIIDLIHRSATSAEKHRAVIPNSQHRVTAWMMEEPKRLEAIADALDTFEFAGLETSLRSI